MYVELYKNKCVKFLSFLFFYNNHVHDVLEVKAKPIATCLHTFSCAWRWLHVFGSISDWFIGLSASLVREVTMVLVL